MTPNSAEVRRTIETRLESVIVSSSLPIGESIARLDKAGTGALVVCASNRKLVGLLTDGDIRRAILKSCPLADPCVSISNQEPITALRPIAAAEALRLMNVHDINQLPVLDADGILRDFILRKDLGAAMELQATAQRRLESTMIAPTTPLSVAIAQLDKAGTGALVLCTSEQILCGLLTDGDLRRAILQGKSMEVPCVTIASRNPVAAPRSVSTREALDLMNRHDIHHLPVVDESNRVVEFLLRKDLVPDVRLDLPAVIMAGGYGKRLLPLTESVPKPMLPVGDRPLLELAIQQLQRAGIRDVSLTTHYLPESIVNHFGDGEEFGVKLNYLKEDYPMGTAGGLQQMKRPESTFLVINGDVITEVPFPEMLLYHRKHAAILTVGVRKYEVNVPFGVVECEDVRITKVQEKPSLSFFINAGTYLLEPSAYDYIPKGQPFDMTDLMQKLLEAGQRVIGFPITEYWLDVGRHEDYQKAQTDVLSGEFSTKILITGGAGYVGSTLTPLLLAAGHQVRVLDHLAYGGESLLGVWGKSGFEFMRGDIRDCATVRAAVSGRDAVVHLAAVVGDPACARQPDVARATNLDASLALIEESRRAGASRFIFASTCSNYGKMKDADQYVDEESELRPVSLYAETKVTVETALLASVRDHHWCPTPLRFSTVYGVSPRMRFDLTVNEFTMEMLTKGHLTVFGEQFWRPYIHVSDAARAIQLVLEASNETVGGWVFNVGATDQNFQKLHLVNMIRPYAPDALVEFVHKDEDPRDYRVSFARITKHLGFKPARTVAQGIEEIARLVGERVVANFGDKKYRN